MNLSKIVATKSGVPVRVHYTAPRGFHGCIILNKDTNQQIMIITNWDSQGKGAIVSGIGAVYNPDLDLVLPQEEIDLDKTYRTEDFRTVRGLHLDPHIAGTIRGIIYDSIDAVNMFRWDLYGKTTLSGGYENFNLREV